VEGELDTLSSWQAGVKEVVAIKGSAFTGEQLDLLGRYSKNVVLALDADAAGEESTKRSIRLADDKGLEVRVVRLEGGKDPDEVAQKNPARWRQQVKEAVSVYDFYLESGLRQYDARSGEGKRKISQELAPILAGMSNAVQQAHYISVLAEKLRVSEESVATEVSKAAKREQLGRKVGVKAERQEREVGREEILAEYLLSLLLHSGDRIKTWLKEVEIETVDLLAVRKVVKELAKGKKRGLVKDGEVAIKKIVERLPAELVEVVQQAWLKDLSGLTEKQLRGEFERVVKELKQIRVRGRLVEVSGKIKALEAKGKLKPTEKRRLGSLRQKFVVWSQELGGLL
jgi:DNA primase